LFTLFPLSVIKSEKFICYYLKLIIQGAIILCISCDISKDKFSFCITLPEIFITFTDTPKMY
jgi:hypothetical protein